MLEVRVMEKDRREIKRLIQTKDKLVKLSSNLKNKIHGIKSQRDVLE